VNYTMLPAKHLASACLLSLFLACFATTASARQQAPLVPESFTLDESAAKDLSAAWLTDDERKTMRVFHGVWDDRDLTTPLLNAIVALNAWDFTNPALADPTVPAELRAEAKLRAG